MSDNISKLDILFINPRDLVAAVPYVKSISHAAVLRDAGFMVDMIDPAPLKITQKEIVEVIKVRQPKVICLSVFPSTLPDAFQTVQLIRKEIKEIVIVLEGYHVNASPSIIIDMNADYGLIGDSEYTMRDLCQSIFSQSTINHTSKGLAVNQNGQLIENEAAIIQDINALPIPAYDLLPIGKYYSASTDKKIMYLFTTRGCPYDCSFCASAAQRNFRHLTIENKIKYVRELVVKHDVKWIEFMDLTFTISKKRTIEFCNAIVAAKLVFDWGCETRADVIDEEIIIAMKAAGCKKITFGVEAGNQKIRYNTGKKIPDEVFIKAFNLCRKHGIRTMANFILGHPGEKESEVLESIQFAKKLKPFNAFFIRMTPLPDVEIYKNGVKNGEIDPDIWIKYMKGETEHPVYYTPSMGQKKIEQLYTKAYREFYFTWNAIRNYLPLFVNIKFLIKSIGVFNRVVFGTPLFK